MDDLIGYLHKLASEMLEQANELGADLDVPPPGWLEKAQTALDKLCSTLTNLHEALERPSSPLLELVRRVDGVRLSEGFDRVKQFLDEHQSAIQALGVDSERAKRIVEGLKELVTGDGTENIETPQTVKQRPTNGTEESSSRTVYAEEVIESLAEFRDLVCYLSKAAEFAGDVLTPQVLKAVAEGTAGVALIVVDVTGAVTVAPHDLTGWVLVKAVKSTVSGFKMAKKATGVLRDAYDRLVHLRNLANLRRHIPPGGFHLRADDPPP